jgi:hypothetical protein
MANGTSHYQYSWRLEGLVYFVIGLTRLSLSVDDQQYSDDAIPTMSAPAAVFVAESPVLLVVVVQHISRIDVAR